MLSHRYRRPVNHVSPCPVALSFLSTAENPLSPEDRHRLHRKLYPILKNSKDDSSISHRLDFLAERAVRHYAAKAVNLAGAHAGARALLDEPHLPYTQSTLTALQKTLNEAAENHTERHQRRTCIHAALAALHAAQTLAALQSPTKERTTTVATQAARAMHWYARVARSSLFQEAIKAVEELLQSKPASNKTG